MSEIELYQQYIEDMEMLQFHLRKVETEPTLDNLYAIAKGIIRRIDRVREYEANHPKQ